MSVLIGMAGAEAIANAGGDLQELGRLADVEEALRVLAIKHCDVAQPGCVPRLDFPARCVATGGLAPLFDGSTGLIDAMDETLALWGLRLIYQRNKPS